MNRFHYPPYIPFFQPGFRENDFFPLTVLAMTLGEIGFVETFVESDNYPFTIDSYILITLFMIIMPIALMNLLVSIFLSTHVPKYVT